MMRMRLSVRLVSSTHKLSSHLFWSHLSRVHGNDSGCNSNANTRDDSTSVPAGDGVTRKEELKDSTDFEDKGSKSE